GQAIFRKTTCASISVWEPPRKSSRLRFVGLTGRWKLSPILLRTRSIRSWRERAFAKPNRCLLQELTCPAVPASLSAYVPVSMRGLSFNLSIVGSQLACRPSAFRSGIFKRVRIGVLAAAGPLCVGWVTSAGDSPARALKKAFDAARASVPTGALAQAEVQYRKSLGLGLRQIGNLSLSEGQYESATLNLDEAVKLTPDDADLHVEDAIAWFRRGDAKKARA